MRPLTPKLSPPAFPANTRPSHAIGASGADSPLLRVTDGDVPQLSSVSRVDGHHVRVAGAAKHPAVAVGDAAVHHQKRVGLGARVLPLLLAGRAIHGVGVIEQREVEHAVDGDDAALKVHRFGRVERTHLPELADIRRRDLRRG